MARERPTALLLDLDGVLRRWDPAVALAVEERYGLAPGALGETALRWALCRPAITGEVSHAEWMANVGDALAVAIGDPERAWSAVTEWQEYRGEVDTDLLAVVREIRAAGIRVGLATNGTDLLDADLTRLGLTDEVDAVVNSAVLGVPKPSREYFRKACAAIGTPPAQVLMVDDEDRMVAGARAAGLWAYRWSGPEGLRYLRAALAR